MPAVNGKGETGETSTRLFVSNLPPSCTLTQLKKHFSSKPTAGFSLTDAQVVHKPGSGSASRCIGFVGFSNSKDASAARKYFNNSYLGSGRLNITFARDSQQKHVSSSPSAAAPPSIPDLNIKSTKLNRRSQMLKSDLEAALAPRSTLAWSNDDEVKTASQSTKRKSKYGTTGFTTSSDDGKAMKCTAKQKKKKPNIAMQSDDGDLQWLREKSKINNPQSQQQQMGDEMIEVSQLEHANEVGKGISGITENKNKSGVEAFSNARLYLKNIPFSCGYNELKNILSPYGRVTELHIPKNVDEDGGGDNRGYAFAQFSSPVEACAAADSLNGFTFQVYGMCVVVLFMAPFFKCVWGGSGLVR